MSWFEKVRLAVAVGGLWLALGAVPALGQQSIWDGLVAYWTFNEGSGDTALDYAGENDGTLTNFSGTPESGWIPDGKIGGALRFDGDNDYIQVAEPNVPVGAAPRTIAGWINIDHTGYCVWLCYGRRYDHELAAMDIFSPSNPVFASHNDDLGWGANMDIARWYHYAMTYDGTTVRLYLDAQGPTSKAIPLNTTLYDAGLLIGAHLEVPGNNTYFWHFDGTIDEAGIWNRALSADEISDLYNDGYGMSFGAGAPRCGDLNCDGSVNFKDINPFVAFLSSVSSWQATYPGCPPQNGDINRDGAYPSFKDINPFVALLSGGGGC